MGTKGNFNIKIQQVTETICTKIEGSMLLRSRAELHKMQGQILAINMFWQVNTARLINLLWLLFTERLSGRVSICANE